jgi:hypothetical protein
MLKCVLLVHIFLERKNCFCKCASYLFRYYCKGIINAAFLIGWLQTFVHLDNLEVNIKLLQHCIGKFQCPCNDIFTSHVLDIPTHIKTQNNRRSSKNMF